MRALPTLRRGRDKREFLQNMLLEGYQAKYANIGDFECGISNILGGFVPVVSQRIFLLIF